MLEIEIAWYERNVRFMSSAWDMVGAVSPSVRIKLTQLLDPMSPF